MKPNRSTFMALFTLACILLVPALALGVQNVTLKWDYPNPPGDLAGFRLYASSEPGAQVFGEANALVSVSAEGRTATAVNLPDGEYYFVCTAFDTRGNESGPSNEVHYTADSTAPPNPQGLQVTVVVNVTVTL